MDSAARDIMQATLIGDAVDNAPIGVFVGDESFRYVAVNRHACTMLGYEREELLGLSPASFSLLAREEVTGIFDELLRDGRVAARTRMRRKDGSVIDVDYESFVTRVSALPLFVTFVRELDGRDGA